MKLMKVDSYALGHVVKKKPISAHIQIGYSDNRMPRGGVAVLDSFHYMSPQIMIIYDRLSKTSDDLLSKRRL